MYQPGETAGFDAKIAGDLIASGIAVDPDTVSAAPPSVEPDEAPVLDARVAAIEEAILTVDDDDYTQTGKPDVDAINDAMPAGSDRVTAAERDAVWAGMQGDA